MTIYARVTFSIIVSRNNGVPPPPPTDLRVTATSRSSVSLTWPASKVDGGSPVTFYRLHYHRQFGDWDRLDVASNMTSYSLRGLRCGTIYQFFMEAINEFGVGERTETVTSATQGTPPVAPVASGAVNSTSIDLNLASWASGGCDISSFVIEYRPRKSSEKDWILVNNNVRPSDFNEKFSVLDLRPSTQYVLRITAHNSAGSTVKDYAFITLNAGGKKASTEGLLIKDSDYNISWPLLAFIIPFGLGAALIGLLLCLKKHDFKMALRSFKWPRNNTEANELDLRITTPASAASAAAFRCSNDYELSEDEEFYGFRPPQQPQPLDTLTHKSNLNSPALAASASLFHHPRKLNEAVNYIHRDTVSTLKSRGSQASLQRMRQPQQPHYVIENHYSTIHWHHPHHHVSTTRPRTQSIHN